MAKQFHTGSLKRLPPWVFTLAILAILLALMQFVVAFGIVGEFFLARPTAIFSELLGLLNEPVFQESIYLTVVRLGIALTISVVIGVGLSVVFWRYELLRKTYIPMLSALMGVPLVLLYLIFVAIFGRGSVAIILISFPLGVIPTTINATDALISVEESYLDVSRTYNASQAQTIRKVIIPAAAPGVFSGIRIGFTYVITSVVAMEFLLRIKGIGGVISLAYQRFNTQEMFVGIVFVIIFVFISIFIARRIEEAVQR